MKKQIRTIIDIGSTHDGKEESCHSAINMAVEHGISDVKFQLLEPNQSIGGNISIKPSWLSRIVQSGKDCNVNVFCSVWTEEAMKLCSGAGMKTIKFAYSMNGHRYLIKSALGMFKEVIVSGDIMHRAPAGCIELFCLPFYPVYYQVSFEGLFPKFSGFSDHTLGISQTINAIASGAKIIEKHVYQNESSKTPDRNFAISWDELRELREATK
jgi:N-acetylneuraminate synthase/N,N'-diacetyllegionaminate synthase